MTYVRDLVKDNFMFIVLGVILLLIASLGVWSNERMVHPMISVEDGLY